MFLSLFLDDTHFRSKACLLPIKWTSNFFPFKGTTKLALFLPLPGSEADYLITCFPEGWPVSIAAALLIHSDMVGMLQVPSIRPCHLSGPGGHLPMEDVSPETPNSTPLRLAKRPEGLAIHTFLIHILQVFKLKGFSKG